LKAIIKVAFRLTTLQLIKINKNRKMKKVLALLFVFVLQDAFSQVQKELEYDTYSGVFDSEISGGQVKDLIAKNMEAAYIELKTTPEGCWMKVGGIDLISEGFLFSVEVGKVSQVEGEWWLFTPKNHNKYTVYFTFANSNPHGGCISDVIICNDSGSVIYTSEPLIWSKYIKPHKKPSKL
jgi:hypothetical protein